MQWISCGLSSHGFLCPSETFVSEGVIFLVR